MLNKAGKQFIELLKAGRHVVCLVGGGGKTTLLYELAQLLAACGRRVLVCTSTHILQPAAEVYAADAAAAMLLWQQHSYAVIGTPELGTGKLTAPPAELYSSLREAADIVLCEADGAKHLPCKVPAAHEPALLADCNIVVAVCGLDALGQPLKRACLRAPLAAALLGVSEETVLSAGHLAQLLTATRGARKNVGSRDYYVLLNKCDLVTSAQIKELCSLLLKAGLHRRQLLLRTLPQPPKGDSYLMEGASNVSVSEVKVILQREV